MQMSADKETNQMFRDSTRDLSEITSVLDVIEERLETIEDVMLTIDCFIDRFLK
jgi:hypothetical protein